jgi:hypothetical protein
MAAASLPPVPHVPVVDDVCVVAHLMFSEFAKGFGPLLFALAGKTPTNPIIAVAATNATDDLNNRFIFPPSWIKTMSRMRNNSRRCASKPPET